MLRTVLLAALALACLSSVAEARPQHGVGKADVIGCSQPEMWPCETGGARSRGRARTAQAAIDAVVTRQAADGSAASSRRPAKRWENPTFELWPRTTIRPARYIAGPLVCAVNVNAELARRDIRGTGSARAKSFLGWGRASRPVAGAVAVYGRRGGGHVAIVSRVVGGRVYVWNPSSRHRAWREVEYRRRAIAYRVAGP